MTSSNPPALDPPLAMALREAQLSTAELAERLGVNQRSVQHWIAGTRNPRRDERLRIGLLLGVASRELWPQLNDAHEISTVAEFPNLAAVPEELWRQRITDAQQHIDICAGSSQFLVDKIPDLRALLVAKTEVLKHHVQIRVMFSDPDGAASAARDAQEAENPDNELGPGDMINVGHLGLRRWATVLEGVPGAELRILDSEELWKRAVFRFDDSLWEYPYIPGVRGFRNAVQQHQLIEVDGRFTDYMTAVEWIWERATPHT